MATYTIEIVVQGKDDASGAFSGVQKGLKDIRETADSSGRGIGGFFRDAFSFATGGLISAGIGKIKDSIGGLISGMVGGNAAFEDYNARFTTLLGSSDAAKERLAALADFGAKTPFELPQVVDADIILQGFGLHSEEAAKRFGFSGEQIRTIAGDVASGTGSSFSEMTLLLGKFSTGATGEAISRMAELGITSRDELTKMGLEFSKSGQLLTPLPQAMQTVLQLMKDKYGGLMDAQSATFNGMVSNLQDWVAGTLRTIGQPIFEVLKDKLGVLLQFLGSDEVKNGVAAFAQSLANGIGQTITFITGTVIPAFQSAWATLGPLINTIIPYVALVIGAFTSGSTSTTGFTTVLNDLGGMWQQVQGIINAVVPPIQAIILTVFGAVQTFLRAHDDDIQSFTRTTWDQISSIIRIALELIQAIVVPVITFIASFISSHQAEIQAILGNSWNAIKALIDGALTIIKGVLTVALQLIKGDWQGAWETVKATAARVWEDIKVIFSSAWDNIKVIFGGAIDSIKGVITGFLNDARTLGANIINGIRDGVLSAVGGLVASVERAVGDAIAGAKALLGIHSPSRLAFEEVGMPLIEGITQGVLNGASALTGALTGVLNQAIGSVRSTLSQIHSLIDVGVNEHAGSLLGAFGGGSAGNGLGLHLPSFASGTLFAPGGLSVVGERGPELVNLPRGTQVFDSRASRSMMAGGGVTNNNYYITANYSHQDERSVRDDIRTLQMLTGG